jgi:hypothetical protein
MASTAFFMYVIFDTFTSNSRVSYNPWSELTSFKFTQ